MSRSSSTPYVSPIVLPVRTRIASSSFSIFSLTSGLDDKSQKNQVKADDVVSRPARMKLMMISLKNSGEFSLFPINRKSKSSWLSSTLAFNLDCIMLSANLWTAEIDFLKLRSDPMLKNFFVFHREGKA
ncbi:hypothetical protein PanWU01x14_228770 [Parasponia andersonii]|uniref:Uncharacterized protein n=1 Tax=Parasponia andersonii TaxID=3476 RepID=A0A2P5BLK2_PARAD|nr:hypothetical protein PanWU01x14_228770 [Parasponia andersonii]